MYWARIEAYYWQIDDLLLIPARRLLNLTLHWMMEHMDGETWDKEFKPTFFPDPSDIARQASKAKIADAKPGQEGSLNIGRKEPAKPVTDLSQFLGRAGGTGKADPNKAALREIASKPAISIGPDANGNLTVDAPEGP